MTAGAPRAGVELSLASLRITGGNPSAEDVAALAAVLAARFAPGGEAGPGAADGVRGDESRGPGRGRVRWEQPAGFYRAPGAWVS
ncbi:acyl-CoA carboxylase epsilon subunit [Streptomyces sp. NPDC006976]|uniref:acyl-CoA carboxylase epsilon subunit n=1 Tax=Streptomyces sp. NPDC006976 TaxID=3154311 RepID=UPI0033DB0918